MYFAICVAYFLEYLLAISDWVGYSLEYFRNILQNLLQDSIIWGSLLNYRNPDPRRVWKGGSELLSMTPFPAHPADPLDPLDPADPLDPVVCSSLRRFI